MAFDFSETQSLVLGGSSGIGFQVAKDIAEGRGEVLLAARSEEKLIAASKKIANSRHMPVDVGDLGSREEFAGKVQDSLGAIDHIVFAAGAFVSASIEDTTEEIWDQIVDTNLKGTFFLLRSLLPMLKKGEGKSIVFVSSILASFGAPGVAAYAASKAGVLGLTKSLSVELADLKIRVNCVSPSYVETPMTEALVKDPEDHAEIVARHPLKRIGQPSDVSALVLFLLSDLSGWTTGQDFILDGGRSTSI